MLLRLAYLGITNAFTLLRLLPGSDRDKDAEILALRHQLAVLRRQLDGQRVRFEPADRALLAALLSTLPRPLCRTCGRWCSPTRSCAGLGRGPRYIGDLHLNRRRRIRAPLRKPT
jgi:hypothetical protein